LKRLVFSGVSESQRLCVNPILKGFSFVWFAERLFLNKKGQVDNLPL
jgi:hypothetical protein